MTSARNQRTELRFLQGKKQRGGALKITDLCVPCNISKRKKNTQQLISAAEKGQMRTKQRFCSFFLGNTRSLKEHLRVSKKLERLVHIKIRIKCSIYIHVNLQLYLSFLIAEKHIHASKGRRTRACNARGWGSF